MIDAYQCTGCGKPTFDSDIRKYIVDFFGESVTHYLCAVCMRKIVEEWEEKNNE